MDKLIGFVLVVIPMILMLYWVLVVLFYGLTSDYFYNEVLGPIGKWISRQVNAVSVLWHLGFKYYLFSFLMLMVYGMMMKACLE